MAKEEREFFQSFPIYLRTPETVVVDLSRDGIPCIPVLGDTHYRHAGTGTKPHVHPGMIEILFCRRGLSLSFDYGGTIHPFLPGDVFVAQPDVPHFLRSYPKNLAMYWIWFRLPQSGKSVLGLSASESRWLVSKLRSLPVRFSGGDFAGRAFRRLWQLYSDDSSKPVERRLLLRDAVLHLLLRLVEISVNQPPTGDDDAALQAVIEEMRQHPDADYPIEELMRRTAMSAPKLSILFRRWTGLPPHAFLVSCRMAKAKEALTSTSQSITEISRKLGFPSAQHFATQFRRDTGYTPSSWRTQHRTEQSKGNKREDEKT
ncbi:MAG: helix-turn-helix transcriptional regulator [Kiritimatiellae bacterium]|nr:helix-turn-helix transcriptional regulator [Kiritimatiellia bacterium]